jgi:Tfp pilus assembly protein PilX
MARMMSLHESSKTFEGRRTVPHPFASQRGPAVIDDMLFVVIVLGIALALLYVHGALKTRRSRRMSADHSS